MGKWGKCSNCEIPSDRLVKGLCLDCADEARELQRAAKKEAASKKSS